MERDRLTDPGMMFTLMLLVVWLSILPGCGDKGCEVRGPVDVVAFQAMAQSEICAEHRNDLFMIDKSLVYWDREGDCEDAHYSRTLFGSTPDAKLCWESETLEGNQRVYADPHYRQMFDIILANRERPDLGLGSGHLVEPIHFFGWMPSAN